MYLSDAVTGMNLLRSVWITEFVLIAINTTVWLGFIFTTHAHHGLETMITPGHIEQPLYLQK
jgi:hypothetical protein